MPIKTFTSATLSSSDVNTYLMNQVVITCTSSTRPGTPTAGMVIYETDTERVLKYNGTAWENAVKIVQDTNTFLTYGSAISAAGSATVQSANFVTAGVALIEYEVQVNIVTTLTAAGLMNLQINGTGVRAIRWHNHGVAGLLQPYGRGVLAVPAAGTYVCAVGISNDGTSSASVTPQEVNYAIREIA